MPSTVVLASRYGLPLDTPPEFVWGYADTMRMDSVRPSCMECVEKHLGAALVLMGEAEAGYPEHKLLAIGHLHEAAEESADMRPELSALLRDIRKSYQQGEAIEFETILEALNQHGVWRFDQRGQGVACGKGWIPRSKKCSSDKAKQTSKEAKAKTVEKSKARAELKRAVKEGKGQKARVKEKPKPKQDPARPDFDVKGDPSKLPEGTVFWENAKEHQRNWMIRTGQDYLPPIHGSKDEVRESFSNIAKTAKLAKSKGYQGESDIEVVARYMYNPRSAEDANLWPIRWDAEDIDSFLQGYLEVMSWRFDRKGEGVACGRGWISRRKKCGRDKSRITSPEAKARTVEKQKVRQQLRGQVKAAKGQKPYVKPKPEPDTPQKYPTRLPKDHVVTTNKRITAARIDKALNAIDSPGAKERVGMFRAFVAKTGVQSVFADPSASLTDHLDVVERGLKDKRYASQDGGLLRNTKADPTAAGYTTFLWNHVVITSDSRGRDGPFAASSEKLKQSADRIFEANAEDELTRDVMAFPFSVSGSVRDRDSSDMMTYIHEMGHQVHAKAGLPAVPMTIKGSATNYGAVNEEEWFAEHFALWMLDAPRYEQLDPAGAQFIRDSLTKATESPVSVEELMARGKV